MNATDPTGHCYFAATAGGRGAMSIGCGGGGGGFGGAAGSTIQLAVDAVRVIVAGATVANAVQGHQESVALPEQSKAEVSPIPLVDSLAGTHASTAVPNVPSQQVLSDPLTSEQKGSNIVEAKIVQRGGHTFSSQAAKELNKANGVNYHSREYGRALEGIKDAFNIRGDNHSSRIFDDGTVEYEVDGSWEEIDNLFNWLD